MGARFRIPVSGACALYCLLLPTWPDVADAQAVAAVAAGAPEARACAAIVGEGAGSVRRCAEWLGELADIESVLSSEETPDEITLVVINERNACRSRGRDPLVDDYLAARAALIDHSAAVRLQDDADQARVDGLFRTAQTICAAEKARALATALVTWGMPVGAGRLCAAAMTTYQTAAQTALAAQESRDPAMDAAADRVVAAGARLQTAWQSRAVELEGLAARDRCVR